jgi:hypothetical protein
MGINEEAHVQRDQIAQDMWDDYQRVCEERGIGPNDTDIALSDNSDSDT